MVTSGARVFNTLSFQTRVEERLKWGCLGISSTIFTFRQLNRHTIVFITWRLLDRPTFQTLSITLLSINTPSFDNEVVTWTLLWDYEVWIAPRGPTELSSTHSNLSFTLLSHSHLVAEHYWIHWQHFQWLVLASEVELTYLVLLAWPEQPSSADTTHILLDSCRNDDNGHTIPMTAFETQQECNGVRFEESSSCSNYSQGCPVHNN